MSIQDATRDLPIISAPGQDACTQPALIDDPITEEAAAGLAQVFKALGDNTIIVDCDVLQADGGTRTAAITGGYVALADAISWLRGREGGRGGARLKGDPLVSSVAAVSVGIVDGQPRLDLCYEEDVAAETDMNVVCTGDGSFVEIQGTAEREPFGRELLDEMLRLAVAGCGELTEIQRRALSKK